MTNHNCNLLILGFSIVKAFISYGMAEIEDRRERKNSHSQKTDNDDGII